MEKKFLAICEGAAAIVLGILLAAFGGQAVLDVYFGIIFVIGGALMLVLTAIGLARTRALLFGFLFAGVAMTLIGSFMLANYYSFGYFVYTIILLIIAAGFSLVLYGIYTIVKFNLFYGIGQIVVGAIAATLGFCYLFVPEFYQAFWIIVGVVIAVYGVFYLILAILSKPLPTFQKDEKVVAEEKPEEKEEK